MERRTIIRALLACSLLLTAAACAGDPLAPRTEEPDSKTSTCRTPAPEPGMVCRGDVWGWN